MRPRRILADLSVFSKGYLRSPIALFFAFAFPVILIVTFGSIFSAPTSKVSLPVEDLDHGSNVSEAFLGALSKTGAVSISQVDPATVNASGGFASWLAKNSDPVGLVIPAGFASAYEAGNATQVTVFTDPEDAADSGLVVGAVDGVANQFNLNYAHGSTIITIGTANVGSQVFTEIDYLVPGLIGFTILTSPMFAIVDITSSYRKDHIFRQLSLTPLTKGEWLTSKIIWYVLITFLTALLMLGVGDVAFGAHVGFDLAMVPFLVLGPFFFVSLGMLAGSVAKTPESAAVIGNIVTFPMMFLSGTFFPVSDFPGYLQVVAHALPLYYVIDGMNQAALFHNYGTPFVLDLTVVLVLSVVVALLAIVAFRWRDE